MIPAANDFVLSSESQSDSENVLAGFFAQRFMNQLISQLNAGRSDDPCRQSTPETRTEDTGPEVVGLAVRASRRKDSSLKNRFRRKAKTE